MAGVLQVPTYWLSLHVPYACRHSGACCSSGWDIPIERRRVSPVQLLRRDGSWLRHADGAPADVAGTLAVSQSGHCVFHDRGCEIHRVLGHAALPSACQHFPREVLIDPRGTFVTLSHYCPTAAELLFTHQGPVAIVEGPPALPAGEPEGLDARDVLPPLLRAGRNAVLMDLEGYSAWEAHMVARLTTEDVVAETSLAALENDLATLRTWRPGGASLTEAVRALPGSLVASRRSSNADMVVGRYLAARAFGSWMAYGGDGAAMTLRFLRVALSTLREHTRRVSLKDAIRASDLQLIHEMPRQELARKVATTGP